MSAPKHDPKVGQVVSGRYRIVRPLGEGGMGTVYEGRHEMIGRRVAIKTLHPHFAQNPELVERFHREANAATSIGNEHIIEVTDFGLFDDGSPYLVMEFLEGVEFGSLLESLGSLPIARAVHILSQTCDALSAAHRVGIVHRDMKPENVYLIKRSGDPDFVKVLDFGISKVRAAGDELGGGLTKTGMAIGTPYYMPPEQAQGLRDIDERADVYALGVILYRALGGRLPFDAETYPALIMKIMTERPAPLSTLRADIPEALDRIVLKAMAKNRDERFQTAMELAAALAPFSSFTQAPTMIASVRPHPMQSTTPLSVSPPAPPPSDSRATSIPAADAGVAKLAVTAGVALAVIGVGAAIWAFSAQRTSPAPNEHVVTPIAPIAPPPAAPQQVAAAMQPVAPAAPQHAEVRVHIEAQPKEARIFIAGAEFPNPTDAFRPRSLDPVRIRVEALGYEAQEQLAIFDQDRDVRFALEKGQGTRELSALAEKPASPRRDKPSGAAPTQAHPAPAAEAPAPASAPAKPADDGIYQGPSGTLRDQF